MHIKNVTLCLLCLTAMSFPLLASPVKISSPDGKIELQVSVDNRIFLQLCLNNNTVMEIDGTGLETDRGLFPSANPKIRRVQKTSVNRTLMPVIREKRAEIPEQYNEAVIEFTDKTKMQFRVYNDGMAYRFILNLPGEIKIITDRADFLFDRDAALTFQKDSDPNSSYESPYVTSKINELNNGDRGNMPALVQTGSGECVLLLEADTHDYPCMWIQKTAQGLASYYWGVPSGYNEKGHPYVRRHTTGNRDYIAQTKASREFPWKVFAVAEKETGLLACQLVYLLGRACKIDDTSWIKPGWVTFDWWSRLGIYGVDFKAGINTETAKYMIDFAAEFGLRYFLFDDGWTLGEDLTRSIPGLDIAAVTRYADAKNVDVMLWVAYPMLEAQMDAALEQFRKWGIKGLKIDCLERSDQEIVNFLWKAAEVCAQNRMVLDFHGSCRPDGLRRAYPNVLTREGLVEFEWNGIRDSVDTPDHHCTLPFIRNVAGPMDYIPGTMNNATRKDFRVNADKPMGQGTRAHSIAMAVICESPMQMLSDAQPLYYRERECTEFLTRIPVEWDEIVPLAGKLGDYVALARRNGNIWYVAAITDWTPRTMDIGFDFLEEGKTCQMEIIRDGVNADMTAVDYKKEVKTVKKGDNMQINLASGGGWIARIF